MVSESSNFYGTLLLVLMLVTVVGIFTEEPIATGFTIKKVKCIEGTSFGECSIVKPRYCDNGALKNDCQRCGCREDEVCQPDSSCLPKCEDGTVFTYCSENKPLYCSKGTLLENCFRCGCFPGQTCLNNGTCLGDIEVGAGSEEKKDATVEKEAEDKKESVEEEEQKPVIKEKPKVSFWKDLFCRIFYSKRYDDCIANKI